MISEILCNNCIKINLKYNFNFLSKFKTRFKINYNFTIVNAFFAVI